MTNNREMNSMQLRDILQERTGLSVHHSSISRLRTKLGWVKTKKGYCQLVRHANRPKRVDFCRQAMVVDDTFDDLIFTDECTVQMDSNGRYIFRRVVREADGNDISEPPPLRPRPKDPYKIHVWAGISKRGATRIALFTGTMDSVRYQDILEAALLSFIRGRFPLGHRFMQDNAPMHTSRATMQFLRENGVNWFRTPQESPDLNLIELMWAEMKFHIRHRAKPKTKDQLSLVLLNKQCKGFAT